MENIHIFDQYGRKPTENITGKLNISMLRLFVSIVVDIGVMLRIEQTFFVLVVVIILLLISASQNAWQLSVQTPQRTKTFLGLFNIPGSCHLLWLF